ncbi:hypothetical protein [Demequina zhanjiangensis]|uniref:Tetratricopeptide repeat-containing protein n=1 Tax=Demequina zhanjiangensis TaxID=3051659 RepID=A0ABT8G398_9MICO|nr:hypothetical protein [Demequina sp. SYSU T00b26]MDN4473616.1 hypothetical protein [Demequina sp. SYSU T00b26]
MRLMRRPAFLGAVAMTVLVALYSVYVGQQAVLFLESGQIVGFAIGVAMLALPVLAVWWLYNEWRLGVTVQRMADRLGEEGRLPVDDLERTESGRISQESADAAFEVAKRAVDERPEDWAAWFHVGFAYDASGDKRMARKSLNYAAQLFRAEGRRG